MKYTEENLIVFATLMICTLGLYSLVWIARVSKQMGDDPVTNVVLVFITFGMWFIFLCLRYMQKSQILNGRTIMWYEVFFVLFPMLAPLVIQMNINEYARNN